MTQLVGHVQREVHAPRHGGDPAVKLAVDEIADSAKGISERDGGAEEVGKPPEVYLMLTAKNNRRYENPDRAPVVRHAADADVLHAVGEIEREDNLEGVFYVMGKIVKKDVTEPRADYEPGNGPDEKVLNRLRRILIVLMLYPIGDEDVGQEKRL